MRPPSLKEESGSALTELAIIAPLFILLVIWSEFFTDLGAFKLKADEAARYAVWEMVAQRPTRQVETEVQQKFAKLYSPDYQTPSRPYDVQAFPSVNVNVSLNDSLPASFGGSVPNPMPAGGGIIGAVVGFVMNLLNQAVNAVIRFERFDTHGEAQATAVTFQARDTLFPPTDIRWLAFNMRDQSPPRVQMTTVSSPLLWDTWKAWPGKASLTNQGNVDTNPYDTYGRPSAPEQEIAARMKNVAFFGVGNVPIIGTIIGAVGWFFNAVGMANPFPCLQGRNCLWTDSSGPVALFPGARANHTWAPGSGMPLQRGGETYDRYDENKFANFDSPDPGVDRSRSTTPSAIHTDWWNSGNSWGGFFGSTTDGGFKRSSTNWGWNSFSNPYVRAYRCRDAWYLGAASGQVKRWGVSESSWARSMTPRCP